MNSTYHDLPDPKYNINRPTRLGIAVCWLEASNCAAAHVNAQQMRLICPAAGSEATSAWYLPDLVGLLRQRPEWRWLDVYIGKHQTWKQKRPGYAIYRYPHEILILRAAWESAAAPLPWWYAETPPRLLTEARE